MKTRLFLALLALACAGAAAAATPPRGPRPPAEATPPGMMANVYRLTEAAAVLAVCRDSDAYRQLPADKATQFDDLATRLRAVVESIGRHYKDDAMPATFEATRGKIAGETAMRGYVKTKYQYCNDALLEDMNAYVAENEKLIGGYIARQSLAPPPPRPAAKP
jgi:hypothetical protein